MGQYHIIANLDKKEFIRPHPLGDGAKLLEWGSEGGVMDALRLLLAAACKGGGRGGGDPNSNDPLIGSWAGDRIAIVGDYTEDSDLDTEGLGCKASEIYDLCSGAEDGEKNGWTNLVPRMKPILEQVFEMIYYGSGWCQKGSLWDLTEIKSTHRVGDERVADGPDGKLYKVSDILVALKAKLAKDGDQRRHDSPKYTLAELKVKPTPREVLEAPFKARMEAMLAPAKTPKAAKK
jgi:hypothetical protein